MKETESALSRELVLRKAVRGYSTIWTPWCPALYGPVPAPSTGRGGGKAGRGAVEGCAGTTGRGLRNVSAVCPHLFMFWFALSRWCVWKLVRQSRCSNYLRRILMQKQNGWAGYRDTEPYGGWLWHFGFIEPSHLNDKKNDKENLALIVGLGIFTKRNPSTKIQHQYLPAPQH